MWYGVLKKLQYITPGNLQDHMHVWGGCAGSAKIQEGPKLSAQAS